MLNNAEQQAADESADEADAEVGPPAETLTLPAHGNSGERSADKPDDEPHDDLRPANNHIRLPIQLKRDAGERRPAIKTYRLYFAFSAAEEPFSVSPS